MFSSQDPNPNPVVQILVHYMFLKILSKTTYVANYGLGYIIGFALMS